jgi:hypothetical protein
MPQVDEILMVRLTKLIPCLLCLAAFLACHSSQSNQHQLLIYTPHGQDMLRDFVVLYKQAHPEAEVQFLDVGSREVLERLRAERNRNKPRINADLHG